MVSLRKLALRRSPFLSRLFQQEQGSAFVELALTLSLIMIPLTVATFEYSLMTYANMQVTEAAHAGASYALQYYQTSPGCPSACTLPTAASVQTVAQKSSPLLGMLGTGAQITVTMATGCMGSAATSGNVVPTCSSGVMPYVQVTASAPVSLPPGMKQLIYGSGNSMTMTSVASFPIVQ